MPVEGKNQTNNPSYLGHSVRQQISYYYSHIACCIPGFPLVLKLNDLEWYNGRYFALFCRDLDIWADYVRVVEVRSIPSTTEM